MLLPRVMRGGTCTCDVCVCVCVAGRCRTTADNAARMARCSARERSWRVCEGCASTQGTPADGHHFPWRTSVSAGDTRQNLWSQTHFSVRRTHTQSTVCTGKLGRYAYVVGYFVRSFVRSALELCYSTLDLVLWSFSLYHKFIGLYCTFNSIDTRECCDTVLCWYIPTQITPSKIYRFS